MALRVKLYLLQDCAAGMIVWVFFINQKPVKVIIKVLIFITINFKVPADQHDGN